MSLSSTISSDWTIYTETSSLTAFSTPATSITSTNFKTTTTTSASAAAATTTTASHMVAPGTIAGAAVAGVFVSAIVVFLLGCLIAYLRKRKVAHQRQLYDARGAHQAIFPPPPPADHESTGGNPRIFDMDSSYSQVQKVYPKMQATAAATQLNPAKAGVAVSSDPSPSKSARSTASTSKLLPLRPPEQLRLKLNTRDGHVSRTHQKGNSWTVFEEDPNAAGSHDTALTMPIGYQPDTTRTSSLRPRGAESGPLPRLLYNPPSITTASPTKSRERENSNRRPTSDITPLSPTYDPRNSPTRRSSISYLPAYYTRRSYFPASPAFTEQLVFSPPVPQSKSLMNLPLPPPPTAHASTSTQPPPPPPPKATRSRSADSNDTSFESLSSDQATPPTETSPNNNNNNNRAPYPPQSNSSTTTPNPPTSQIHYPKIPRSTNQAIPHPSLLEKRRGADAARDVENGLWWKDARRTPAMEDLPAALKISGGEVGKMISRKPLMVVGGNSGVARVGEVGRMGEVGEVGRMGEVDWRNQRAGEMVLKSPVWQPRLTPTRGLGGEMVIQIS